MKARITSALIAHAEAVLAQVLRFDHPADAVTSHYFREHRQLGHADRGFVAEAVFAVLRRLPSLRARCGDSASARQLLLAGLIFARGYNLREIESALKESERAWLSHLKAVEPVLSPADACDLPAWLHARLAARLGEEETLKLARALNQAAPLDLRCNTLKQQREKLLAALQADGMAAEPTPFSPLGIRLREKPALAKHPLFMDGSFEVQDEGSQLLGLLLEPKRGETFVERIRRLHVVMTVEQHGRLARRLLPARDDDRMALGRDQAGLEADLGEHVDEQQADLGDADILGADAGMAQIGEQALEERAAVHLDMLENRGKRVGRSHGRAACLR